jgi:hypothetical protein
VFVVLARGRTVAVALPSTAIAAPVR